MKKNIKIWIIIIIGTLLILIFQLNQLSFSLPRYVDLYCNEENTECEIMSFENLNLKTFNVYHLKANYYSDSGAWEDFNIKTKCEVVFISELSDGINYHLKCSGSNYHSNRLSQRNAELIEEMKREGSK